MASANLNSSNNRNCLSLYGNNFAKSRESSSLFSTKRVSSLSFIPLWLCSTQGHIRRRLTGKVGTTHRNISFLFNRHTPRTNYSPEQTSCKRWTKKRYIAKNQHHYRLTHIHINRKLGFTAYMKWCSSSYGIKDRNGSKTPYIIDRNGTATRCSFQQS